MLWGWGDSGDPDPGWGSHHSKKIPNETNAKGATCLCLALYRISRAYFLSYRGLVLLQDYCYVPNRKTFGMRPKTQHFGQLLKLHNF